MVVAVGTFQVLVSRRVQDGLVKPQKIKNNRLTDVHD